MKNNIESIVLGGGCFWCLEAVFLRVKGVEGVVSGYAGGKKENPTYEEVSGGKTGHAETVKIDFDPEVIKLEDILRIFFTVHDPTTINRQGNDVGEQYRSVILYSHPKHKEIADVAIREIADQDAYENPVITEVSSLEKFYPAEEYHQRYFEKNPNQAYCQLVVEPKVAKLRKKYKHLYKE